MSKRKQFEQDADAGQLNPEELVQAKRPYRAPRLTVYGSLRKIALGVGGAKSDGGGTPKSRA